MAPSKRNAPEHRAATPLSMPPHGDAPWSRLAPELAGASIDALSSHVALLDSGGNILAVNVAWARFGVQNGAERAGACVGMNYLSVCDSATGPVSEEARRTGDGLRRLLSGAIEEFRQQYRCETATGVRWYQMRAARFTHERRVYAVVAHEDISEIMRAQEALAESERRFLQITSVIDQVFWMTCLHPERVVYVNPAFEQLWGARCEDLYRDPRLWTSRIHDDDRARVENTYGRWIAGGGRGSWQEEYRLRRPDGSIRWIQDRAHAVPPSTDGQPSGLVCGLAEDVTELRTYRDHLEHLVEERTRQLRESNELLAQQDRLASIGTLAAGLGHDLANILFPMRCRLDVLESAELPASLRPEVHGLRSTIEYLQRLSSSLRMCALDPLDPGPDPCRTVLHEWVDEACPIIDKSIPERIELRCHIRPGLPPVALAPHQLTQAALNLVGNAVEAIDGAGTIDVDARLVENPATVVELSVRDSGCGMSDETRRHALHPFFTTKKRGRSTGLGLTIVHSILKSVGGDLRIDSRPEQGTTVTLRLPVADGRVVDDSAPRAGSDAAPSVVVSLIDPRRAALVRHVATSLGMSVRDASAPGRDGADILVTDSSAGARSAAESFLHNGPGRTVVLFGRWAEDWAALDPVRIDESAGLDGLRSTLRTAAMKRITP